MKHKPDQNTAKIRKWLKRSVKHVDALSAFLKAEGYASEGIAHLLSGHNFKAVRTKVLKQFKIN
jgi:hypothetical protein